MAKLNIVSDGAQKNKKLLFIIGGILVAALIVGGIFAAVSLSGSGGQGATPDEADYERTKLIYEAKGISYSKEDYEKDKAAEEASDPAKKSDAAKQLESGNEQILQDFIDEHFTANVSLDELKQSIIQQTSDFNSWIDNSFGWPASEYPDEEGYGGARQTMAGYCDGMAGDEFSHDYDFDDEVVFAALRYSTAEKEQFHMYYESAQYYDILKNYFQIRHPKINEIYDISLISLLDDTDNLQYFDDVCADLKAVINTDQGNFEVYLSSQISGDAEFYKILDIIQI